MIIAQDDKINAFLAIFFALLQLLSRLHGLGTVQTLLLPTFHFGDAMEQPTFLSSLP